jgi:hypothetical protein
MDAITDAPRTDDLTLYLERRLNAPRELVFDAWIDPLHLKRWSAPHGFEIPECGGEARDGGTWHATMRSPEGKLLRLVGTYREVMRGVSDARCAAAAAGPGRAWPGRPSRRSRSLR